MSAPTYRNFAAYSTRRVGMLRWAWQVTDGHTGPELLSGYAFTQHTARKAAAGAAATCMPWAEPVKPRIPALTWSPEQTAAILDRYAADLHAADPLTFDRMACRAECCTGRLAVRMRELVDVERWQRLVAAGAAETEVQPQGQATVSGNPDGGDPR